MAKVSEHTLNADQAEGSSTTGYLIFNGSPSDDVSGFVTQIENGTLIEVRAKSAAEASKYLTQQGFPSTAVELERWSFRDSIKNDRLIVDVWVPQSQ